VITICGAFSQAFSPRFWILIVLRCLLGFGVGLTGVVCPLYVSEMADLDHEEKTGFLGTLFQLAITVGIVFAFLVGLIIRLDSSLGDLQWRLIIGTGILPAILLLVIGVFLMPESTSWLRSVGNENASLDISGAPSKNCCEILSRKHFKKFITGVMLAACLQLTGINVVMFFGGDILNKTPIGENDVAVQLANLGIGVWNSITTIIGVALVGRMKRKTLIIAGTVILTGSNVLIGFGGLLSKDPTANTFTAVVVVFIGLALFLLGFEIGPGCLFWVLVNEIFPPEIKEQGVGLVNLLQWGFNLLVTSVFPELISATSLATTFWIYAGIGVLVVIYLQLFLEETNDKSAINGTYDENEILRSGYKN
jgi:MFS family permease